MKQGDRQDRAAGSGSGGVPPSESQAGAGRRAEHGASFAERFVAVGGAQAALAGVVEVLTQCPGAELGSAFAALDDLVRAARAAQVGVLGEALERGEVASSDHPSPAAWVLAHGPSFRDGGAADLVKVAQACNGKPVGLGAEHLVHDSDGTGEGGCGLLREAVLRGRVGVRGAAVALAEMHKLAPRLCPEALPTVWAGFLQVAAAEGPAQVRGLREAIIATYGRDGEFQVRQDRLRHGVSLSQPCEDDGMFDYSLRLDPEGKAVLEAMLGRLSAPRPTAEVSDLRASDQRRGDALVEICRRAAAAGGDAPATTKAQLFVTMDYEQLKTACGAGTDLLSGRRLAPETVRRIACDAGIIPVVLGGAGEILELGRTRRLFPPGLLKALWLRDKGCTVPGCTAPPQWADAHHVIHWADGGPTDLRNAALLCPRHHTLVHQRGWTATVTATGVTWHR